MPFFYPVTNKAPQLSSRTLIKLKLKVEIKEHLGLRRERSDFGERSVEPSNALLTLEVDNNLSII